MRTTEINGITYISRNQPMGYGYEIISKTPIDEKRIKYDLVFHSYNRDLVKSTMDRFMKGEVVTDFPDTSDEVPPMKILVYRSKHYTNYYNVPTPESLDKTFRHILKQEWNDCLEKWKPINDINNDSGVTSQEEIDSIPVDDVREDVQRKWDEYQKKIKKNKWEMNDWENLRLVVREDKGSAKNAMDTHEAGNWEIENLTEIK